MKEENLKDGHYLINGNKVLYRQDGIWYKPVKNAGGRYSGNITALEKQPKIIKSIEHYRVMGF